VRTIVRYTIRITDLPCQLGTSSTPWPACRP